MTELFELPQIVAARTPSAIERATNLFRTLTPTTVTLAPEEAELAKLFTNVWRYIKFAASNQLYMIANDFGSTSNESESRSASTTHVPPTCRGSRLRRRPVSAEGHDAAGRVRQQQLLVRATRA